MTLPPLTIPNIPLPFEIPAMIHPVFVHFAVALPILVLILELINLFAKKRTVGVLSFFFMILIAAVFLGAYLTGSTDGKAAKAFLSPEAKEALMAHKQLGVYLVYASGLLMLFKLFSVMIRKSIIRVLFFLVLIIFAASVLNEGKKGGALVYQYGINVQSVPAIGKEKPSEPAAVKKDVSEATAEEVKMEAPKVEVPEAEASKAEETTPAEVTTPEVEKATPPDAATEGNATH